MEGVTSKHPQHDQSSKELDLLSFQVRFGRKTLHPCDPLVHPWPSTLAAAPRTSKDAVASAGGGGGGKGRGFLALGFASACKQRSTGGQEGKSCNL